MESKHIRIGDWILRIRQPKTDNTGPVIFLLHGWQGTEDVMWIFANKIPEDYLIIAPRAIYPAVEGGFTWVSGAAGEFSVLDQFKPAVDALESLSEELALRYRSDFSNMHLMGFSQGAALSYAWAALYPGHFRSIAGLAGFVPEGIGLHKDPKRLKGVDVFAAHGLRDDTVPIRLAETGLDTIRAAGAAVTFCTDDVGHKLGSNCMKALGEFYLGMTGPIPSN